MGRADHATRPQRLQPEALPGLPGHRICRKGRRSLPSLEILLENGGRIPMPQDANDSRTPEQRLKDLGIELPPAPGAAGDYLPYIITGNLLMTSGQLPWINGELKFKGKIGAELNLEQGYQAFRLSALNAIAQVRKALGSLDRVKQIVRLEGTFGCAPGFTEHPKVLNGASHIVNEVFGPRGLHTRMVQANTEMALDCATLVVLIAEIG
jgi:enamine deaminase RidA (YjgF/YER057c/UK114 family)